MAFPSYQITKQPQRVWSRIAQAASAGSIMVINPDTQNSVWLGHDQGIVANGPGTVQLAPLATTVAENTEDLFIVSAGPSVTINVAPSLSQWTPSPAQIASSLVASTLSQEIAALIATGSASGAPGGAPSLRYTNNLANSSQANVAAGTSVQPLNAQAVKQPSFEAAFFINMHTLNAGTVPFALVEIDWIDSVSGQTIDIEQYYVSAGNGPGNQITTFLRGPCNANSMSVFITNSDPAVAMDMVWTISETSQLYDHDRLFQPKYALAPNGFTNPNGTPMLGILAIANPSTGPTAVSSRLLATWNGKVNINIDARAQANNISYTLQDPTPAGFYTGTVNGELWAQDTPAGGGFIDEEISFPNGPLLLTIRNRGASGNVAPMVALTKIEY